MKSRTRRERAALASPLATSMPAPLQLGLGGGQRVLVADQEAGADHPGLALDQGQAVVALVGAQVGDAVLLGGQLHADDVHGEAHRVVQVGRSERT
ncbi:hypothetical protein [Nonomuraea rubra]|uniref:hypothetical protein n=1 Tax=Nonomuraea rubra TaxID=46180 RepID=UPI0031EDD0E3